MAEPDEKTPEKKPTRSEEDIDDVLWEIPFARPVWKFFVREGKAVKHGWVAVAVIVGIAIFFTHRWTEGDVDAKISNATNYFGGILAKKESEISNLKGQLTDARQDRNHYQEMLAPFEAMAISKYTNAPMEERLDLLVSGLSEISTTLHNFASNEPTFQVFFRSDSPVSTNETDTITNGILTRMLQISVAHVLRGLNPGDRIDLKSSRDISLGVSVFGKKSADHLVIELITPWRDKTNNINGDKGWMDLGQYGDFMDPTTKTYSRAHGMRIEFGRPLSPNSSYPLPTLHIPTNYGENVLPLRFRMFANNSTESEAGVLFNIDE